MADQRVADLAAAEPAWAAYEQHDADATVMQGAFHARKGDAMIGRADDQRVLGQAGLVQRGEDAPDFVVERARHGFEARHVFARGRRIGQWRRRQAGARIILGMRLGKFAMRLGRADIQEERRARRAA